MLPRKRRVNVTATGTYEIAWIEGCVLQMNALVTLVGLLLLAVCS